ncbi:MAG: hypothetical protein V4671_13840 [Armatimonadota bacterium]
MKTARFATLILLCVLSLLLPAAQADDETTKGTQPPPGYNQEGRPADPVPPALGGTQLTPPPTGAPGQVQVGTPGASDPRYGGVLYEKNRIKRTVPIDPAIGLDGRWDVLYRYVDSVAAEPGAGEAPGGNGVKTVYCDWDDNYLYLAMETPSATKVRFDIDGRDDGWLRGADNLMLQISPSAGTEPAKVIAQRFDTTQNKDRPVYAESSIPLGEIKVRTGQTPRGTYAAILALPKTEMIGLVRKNGASFGLRVDTGLLPAQSGSADLLAIRPMLRLTLAESVVAQSTDGLSVKVSVAEARKNVPGEDIKIALEVKNEGKNSLRLSRLFLRGSLLSQNLLDAATYTGIVLEPGKKLRRDLRSTVSASAGTGTYVVAGGAEWEDGTGIASLAAFDRLEPYALDFKLDDKPIESGVVIQRKKKGDKKGPEGDVRTAVIAVLSRIRTPETASVRMRLPDGWTLESGDTDRTVQFKSKDDLRPLFFKILVPNKASPGTYPVSVTLEVAGHTYTESRSLTILGNTGNDE